MSGIHPSPHREGEIGMMFILKPDFQEWSFEVDSEDLEGLNTQEQRVFIENEAREQWKDVPWYWEAD